MGARAQCRHARLRARLCTSAPRRKPEFVLPVEQQATFEGFRRANGKAGTRNYVGILTSVNCSASVARFMAEEVKRSGMLADYPNIDGVIALTHGTGCGIDYQGRELRGAQAHQLGLCLPIPIWAAVLMVGLGCEGFQIGRMKEAYGIERERHLPHPDHPGDRRHARRRSSRRRGAARSCCRSPTARSARPCRPPN